MKKLFTIIALAIPLIAMAATTTLTSEGCSSTRMCSNVDGQGTTLSANSAYGGIVQVFLADGNYYLGRGTVGLSIASYPVYLQPNASVPVNGNPTVMWVTADWITWTTKGSGSGRGGYQVHTHWDLVDGTLVTP